MLCELRDGQEQPIRASQVLHPQQLPRVPLCGLAHSFNDNPSAILGMHSETVRQEQI